MFRLVRSILTVMTVAPVALVLMSGNKTFAQGTCTTVHKCGSCLLYVSKKGHDSVVLNLRYANQFNLRGSGYIDTAKFPSWKAGPPSYNSTLPIYLRVGKTSDSSMVYDAKLKDVHVRWPGEDSLFGRTITGFEADTNYTAFAYANFEGGLTQGVTDKAPFVRMCFKTFPDPCQPRTSHLDEYGDVLVTRFGTFFRGEFSNPSCGVGSDDQQTPETPPIDQ